MHVTNLTRPSQNRSLKARSAKQLTFVYTISTCTLTCLNRSSPYDSSLCEGCNMYSISQAKS